MTVALLMTVHVAFANEPAKEEVKKNDGIWADFLGSIRGAKLTQKLNLPSVELFRVTN